MKPTNRLNPTIPPTNGREIGERHKRDALELHEANRDDLLRRARRAMLEVMLRNGSATADDVAGAIELPPGVDGRFLGSVPGPLAKAHMIRGDGYRQVGAPVAARFDSDGLAACGCGGSSPMAGDESCAAG